MQRHGAAAGVWVPAHDREPVRLPLRLVQGRRTVRRSRWLPLVSPPFSPPPCGRHSVRQTCQAAGLCPNVDTPERCAIQIPARTTSMPAICWAAIVSDNSPHA